MVVARAITILRSHRLVVELRISKTLVEPEIEMIKGIFVSLAKKE